MLKVPFRSLIIEIRSRFLVNVVPFQRTDALLRNNWGFYNFGLGPLKIYLCDNIGRAKTILNLQVPYIVFI